MAADQIIPDLTSPGQLGQWVGKVDARLSNIESAVYRIEDSLSNHIATEQPIAENKPSFSAKFAAEAGKTLVRPLVLAAVIVSSLLIFKWAHVPLAPVIEIAKSYLSVP